MIRMAIDKKSLFYNIKNDNKKGHTATVATPLKQGNMYNKGLHNLLQITTEMPDCTKEKIIGVLLSNSRARVKINNVYIFDNISINGIAVKQCPAFCLYIREEIDPYNFHYGRMKVHYPMSFSYSDYNVSIDNKAVLKAISECLGGYAFVVEAFEYDDLNKHLNFDAVIVGNKDVPYSKVFSNGRYGSAKTKQMVDNLYENYDAEIIGLKEAFGYDKVNAENYLKFMLDNQSKARKICEAFLLGKGASQLKGIYEDYPNALYDFEYYDNSIKRYVILKFSSTEYPSFVLNIEEIMFCQNFNNSVSVCFISCINNNYRVKIYNMEQLNEMRKVIKSIAYIDMEE